MGIFPGGAFHFGTENVRGVDLRVFKSLPPALGKYYKYWFSKHSDKEWLVYENDRLTFGEARRQYEALGAELRESPHFKFSRANAWALSCATTRSCSPPSRSLPPVGWLSLSTRCGNRGTRVCRDRRGLQGHHR